MATEKQILRYFRDCYEADNRESAIFNLLDQRVRRLMFPLMGGELLRGAIDRLPIERHAALEAAKEAELHQTEKSLVFAAFFLVGRVRDEGRKKWRKIFAPLVFYPAAIEDKAPYAFLRIDPESRRLNLRVLGALDEEINGEKLDEFAAQFPQLPIRPEMISDVSMLIERLFPRVDLSMLESFPNPPDESEMRLLADKKTAGIILVPGTALALVPNSPDTREVLAELAMIASHEQLSHPLEAILTPQPAQGPPRAVQHRVPAALSGTQQKALASAAKSAITLIVGPPGTGKSFTVACIAIDAALRGESVLIASKMDQAVDVIRDKIRELAGESFFVVRGGRGSHERRLKASIGELLTGLTQASVQPDRQIVKKLEHEVKRLRSDVERREKRLEKRAALETRWGELETSGGRKSGLISFLTRQRQRLLEWRFDRKYWEEIGDYQRQLGHLHSAIPAFLRADTSYRTQHTLNHHRQSFISLDRAFRARTKRKLHEYFAEVDLRILFEAMPIWMTTLSNVGNLVPLTSELFDLVIIDEATQCDCASCLPVLYRGRRAVVTGDPKQLRHVSFLSESRLAILGERHELDVQQVDAYHYRKKSMLDLVSESLPSQHQLVFLDEHFRSQPHIIAFSNREFYNGRLRIMTQRPETMRHSGLSIVAVNGRRDKNGVNRQEVDEIVSELSRWIAAEIELPPEITHSIGVLSPFRDQVDAISVEVGRKLGLEAIEKHRIRIGTAHSFQGEERDVMLLSFVVDPESHGGALRFLNRPDVFNVSVTRARAVQTIYCSLPLEANHPGLLGKYISHIRRWGGERAKPEYSGDHFLIEVMVELERMAFKTWPAYPVAGREIDLIVERNGRSLGIDLIGHPGPFHEAFSLESYRMFQRAGLRLIPLPMSAWFKDRKECLAMIERALKWVPRFALRH